MRHMPRRDALRWTVGTAAAVTLAPGALVGGRALARQPAPGGPISATNPREWVLRSTVNIRSYQPRVQGRMPRTEGFEFKNTAMIYPLVDRSAASVLDLRGVKGRVEFNDRLITDTHTVIEGYHSGAKYARFDLDQVTADEVELEVELPTRCYRLRLDEEAAGRYGWPRAWPAEAASTFEPQMYVNYDPRGEYDMKVIQRLVNEWTGGKPKSQPPYITAKWITGQVVNMFQPSGQGLNFDRSGAIEGLEVEGAAVAAQRRRGTPFDMVAFYVAAMREAGIPTRIVVGYDAKTDRDDGRFLGGGSSGPQLRVWSEWYLHDDASGKGWWIPADVVETRRTSSRLPNNFMERKVAYFGSHDDLDYMIPISFHFHPPTTVRAYNSPGFWGWFSLDDSPDWAYQALTFNVRSRSTRPGDDAFQDDRRNAPSAPPRRR